MGKSKAFRHGEEPPSKRKQLSILDITCYRARMKLIVNLKLVPTPEQAKSLKATLERANAACHWMSKQGWIHQTLKQYALHKLTYHAAKEKFALTAQMVVRCIAKVADAYKLDQKRQRTFKKHGSIPYDDRIIRFTKDEAVNLWTVQGRLTIPFQCGDYQRKLLPFRKGEVDLVFRQGNFYLNAVCEVEEPLPGIPQDILGVDFGVVNIATDSDAQTFPGMPVEAVRERYHRRRQTLQKAAAKKSARRTPESDASRFEALPGQGSELSQTSKPRHC